MITLAKIAAPATVGVHALHVPADVADLAAAYTARQFDADWSPAPVARHGVNLVNAMTSRNCLASLAEYIRDMRA